MRKVRNQKGFTIMELMIVIVIIGILIAIAVPAYNSFRNKAAVAACDANQRTIESAAGIFYADTGAWPAAVTDLWPAAGTKYIDAAITCPSGGGYTITNGKVDCDAAGHN